MSDVIFAAIRIFRPTHIEAENARERLVIALDHGSGTAALVSHEHKAPKQNQAQFEI